MSPLHIQKLGYSQLPSSEELVSSYGRHDVKISIVSICFIAVRYHIILILLIFTLAAVMSGVGHIEPTYVAADDNSSKV